MNSQDRQTSNPTAMEIFNATNYPILYQMSQYDLPGKILFSCCILISIIFVVALVVIFRKYQDKKKY